MAGKTHDTFGGGPVKQAGSLEKPELDEDADLPDYGSAYNGASTASTGSGGYGGSSGTTQREATGDTEEPSDGADDGDDGDQPDSDEARTDGTSDSSAGDSGGDQQEDGSRDGWSSGPDGSESDPDGTGSDGPTGGGRVSIDIQALTALIAAMERARDQIPEYQAEFRMILTDAGLAEDGVPGKARLDQVVAWIEDQLPQLRRRLALAQALNDGGRGRPRILPDDVHLDGRPGTLPGEPPQDQPVIMDESAISGHPPHVSRDNARTCAARLSAEPGQARMDELITMLDGNQHDPFFAHEFTNSTEASAVRTVIDSMRSGPGADAGRADQLQRLVSDTVATARRGTGELAPSDGFDERWAGFTAGSD